MSLINREALYEKACGLEAQALSYVGKIVNDETRTEEWRIWSAVLAERTAFKHDIFDAPTIDPVRKGKWIHKSGTLFATCSECGVVWGAYTVMNYCPDCGADMRGEQDK